MTIILKKYVVSIKFIVLIWTNILQECNMKTLYCDKTLRLIMKGFLIWKIQFMKNWMLVKSPEIKIVAVFPISVKKWSRKYLSKSSSTERNSSRFFVWISIRKNWHWVSFTTKELLIPGRISKIFISTTRCWRLSSTWKKE